MKILFIETRKKFGEIPDLKINLPREIHILYTIQYKNLAEKIKKQLEKNHRILGFDQIIGCSKLKLKADALLITSGTFHAKQLALFNDKEISILENEKLRKISKQQISKLKAIENAKLSRFLASDNIGLLVSKKPGQNKSDIKKIKNRLENKFPKKDFYVFIIDTLNLNELENFSIDFWINTSCPGLELDNKKIINYEKIQALS